MYEATVSPISLLVDQMLLLVSFLLQASPLSFFLAAAQRQADPAVYTQAALQHDRSL